jgi:hypothetical protein
VVLNTQKDSKADDDDEDNKDEDEKKVGRPGKVRGYVTPDYHTNSLIIQASREDMDRLLKLVEQVDEPGPRCWSRPSSSRPPRMSPGNWASSGAAAAVRLGQHPFVMTPAGYLADGILVPYYGTSPSGQGFGINFPTSGALSSAATSAPRAWAARAWA